MGSFRRPSTIISAISYIHITTQSGSKHSVHSQHHPRRVSSRYCILHTPIFTKMAVQSTMQPINTKIYNHQHLSQCKQSFDSTATSPTVLMASTACYSAVDLPLPTLLPQTSSPSATKDTLASTATVTTAPILPTDTPYGTAASVVMVLWVPGSPLVLPAVTLSAVLAT